MRISLLRRRGLPSSLQTINVQGLLNVVLSLTTAEGHILPHCDGLEGHQFARHQLVLVVPQPAAQIRVCNTVHEFIEGELITFNVSQPHEVINPSSAERMVLLFDTLHDNIINIPENFEMAMRNLHRHWKGTVMLVDKMNQEMKSSAQVVRSEEMLEMSKKNKGWQDCVHEVTWQKTEEELAAFYKWKALADGCCECVAPGSPELKDPEYVKKMAARVKEDSYVYKE
jgi:hypothetical protein